MEFVIGKRKQIRDRHGFLLQLAVILIVLFGLYVVSYFLFVQNQNKISSKLLAGEIAHHLAQAGVSTGIAYFTNTRQPSSLYETVLKSTVEQIEAAPIENLPVSAFPVLQAMVDDYDATLEVKLSLTGFKPFYQNTAGDSGIQYNTVEKSGTLRVESIAEVDGARRILVALKDVKVRQSVPYVVGKFTLFSAQRFPGQRLNELQIEKTSGIRGQPHGSNVLMPLFLTHGPSADLDEKGWVYLGGGDYKLNLAWGDDGWGDQDHIVNLPWKVTYDPTVPGGIPGGSELFIVQRGMFHDIHNGTNVFNHFDFSSPPPGTTEEPVGNGAALIKLFGSPPGSGVPDGVERSPTYVIGKVIRRFLEFKYLKSSSATGTAYLPYSTLGAWLSPSPSPWASSPPFDVKTDIFNDDFGAYANFMSRVIEEPYNRGIDFITAGGDLDPGNLAVSESRLRHLRGYPRHLYSSVQNNGEVIIKSTGTPGNTQFEGYLSRIRMSDMYFKERAVFTLPADRFADYLASKKNHIPGILHFEGGDVRINSPLELESGGIIAVTGKISIEAPIRVKSYGRPLTLASLSGNIEINEAVRVEAFLVALNGTVTKAAGFGLDIKGGIAAKTLDIAGLCDAAEPGHIAYDPRFDPTDPSNVTYTVHLSHERELYMPQ